MTLRQLLQTAVDKDASDLHLQDGMPPILRVRGELEAVSDAALDPQQIEALLLEGLPEEEHVHLGDRDYQTSFNLEGIGRLRVSLYRQNRTIAASLRIIPSVVPSLDKIRAPEGLRRLCDLPSGLVLVTGPSGSGKTTTLMSMLDHINATRAVRIVSIGDPVEIVLQPKKATIILREVGVDADSYHTALRSALRQDPDIIHISEMTDLPTLMMAITLSEMGHLVFSNMHCRTVGEAIERIVDVFPEEQRAQVRMQLAENVGGIVAQRLAPHASGKGRVAVVEILHNTPQIRELIIEGRTDYVPVLEANRDQGMMSFDQCLAGLVSGGLLKLEDALKFASSRKRLEELME